MKCGPHNPVCQTLRLLQAIQRRATRAILGCNSHPKLRPSYKSCLIYLNLLPISYWFGCRDLFFFYKSLHGAYNFPLNNFMSFATGNTRSATNLNLRSKSFHTFRFRDSFFYGIVPLWNNLPVLIRQSPTFLSFKTNLYKYYFCKLKSDFYTDRIRTWKTVCPHCRSINSLFGC